VMRYQALTESGARRAKEVAEWSLMWKLRVLGTCGYGVHLHRLVLEYARLMDEDRDAGYFMFKR